MIALCSVICGGENAMDMAAFEKAKEPLLRGFLRLPNGVPSHDTFSRLFRWLDPAPFGAAFSAVHVDVFTTMSRRCGHRWQGLRRSHDRPGVNQRCIWSAPGDASNA